MSTTETTDKAETKTAVEPRFDLKQYEKGGQFENATVIDIAQVMSEAPTDEIKYKFAKIMLDRTKSQFIDPMKSIREKEKADQQKEAEERAAKVAEYRERVNALFTDELLEDFAEIAADYGEAGHGKILSVELFAKQGEDGKWKAEFNSNIAKARAARATSTRTRDAGPTGAGVWVEGKAKDGSHEIDRTEYDSFADAARALGYVDDSTNMKGLNCKRLLESKGFTTGYLAPKPAAEPAQVAVRVINSK